MPPRWAAFFSLFTSVGTLLCCALPALLVTLGMGAVVAGAVSQFPGLIWLSERKLAVFGSAGFMLLLAGFLQWRARDLPCPIDVAQARACDAARRLAHRVWILSVVIFVIGASMAFLPELLGAF